MAGTGNCKPAAALALPNTEEELRLRAWPDMRRFPSSFFALLVIVVLAACSSMNNTPAPSKFGTFARSAVANSCEALDPFQCVGAFGFQVDQMGNFMAGNPSSNSVVIQGTITADERAALLASANRFLSSAQNTGTCPDLGAAVTIPGSNAMADVTTSLATNNNFLIFDSFVSAQPGCLVGDPVATGAYVNQLMQLMKKYYPVPYPGTVIHP